MLLKCTTDPALSQNAGNRRRRICTCVVSRLQFQAELLAQRFRTPPGSTVDEKITANLTKWLNGKTAKKRFRQSLQNLD
jgi:hypothetical protein